MRKGRFEELEGPGGEKCYRLKWEQQKQCPLPTYSLSSKEVLSGLFIRYLISRGKLSEFKVASRPGPDSDEKPRRRRRK